VAAAIAIAVGPQQVLATMMTAAAVLDAAVAHRHLPGQAPHLAHHLVQVSTPPIAQVAQTSTLTMAVHS